MNLCRKSTMIPLAFCLAFSGTLAAASTKPAPKPAAQKKSAPPAGARSAVAPQLLDNFIKVDWATAKDNSSEIKLSQVAGPGGSALRISYDLKNGKWVSISKNFAIDDFKGKAFTFQIKSKGANNNLEVKLIDEDDSNFGVKRPLLTESGDWTTMTLSEADFSYWWGGDPVLGRIKDINFSISAGDGGAGELLVADLRMGQASKEGNIGKGGVIFDGQTKEGWMVAKGESSSITLESGTGQKGTKAMAVRYSIPAGQWVSIRRAINADLSGGNPRLVFRLKGEGDPCDMEVKLIDRDDSVFGKVFTGLAGGGQWVDVTIPLSDFSYMWGGVDNRLDASLVRYMDVAISGSTGGAGKVLINDIRVAK
jgi:hypothetical protein